MNSTAWLVCLFFLSWAVPTASGIVTVAIFNRRKSPPYIVATGGLLGSALASLAPIIVAVRNSAGHEDAGYWCVLTAALATIGSVSASLAVTQIERGIANVVLKGFFSGCAVGGGVALALTGLVIAGNEGHVIAILYAPILVTLGVVAGAAYGAIFGLLFALGCALIRSISR
jgi:hypothetical protein